MDNSVRVSLEFSYQGETFSPSAVIDLDSVDISEGKPDWHAMLAARNSIDTYSYAHEVMQASDLVFSDAKGLAAQYTNDGRFDFDGFIQSRGQEYIIRQLRSIAKETLGIEALNNEPAIEQALLQAFELGRRS